MTEQEKAVNLLIYKTHIRPSLTYCGGIVNRISMTNNNEATTLQAFMVSSMFSKYKDVIALFPVQYLTTDLYDITNSVLKVLNDTGFKVLSIIPENYVGRIKLFFR